MSKEKENKENKELEEALKKVEENLAGWKRAMADYQNLEKQVARDREMIRKFATEDLIINLLPVLDQSEQALKNMPLEIPEEIKSWTKGGQMVFEGLKGILKNHGLERINSVGEKFDPVLHESMESRKEENKNSGIVLEEIRAGYKLNGEIIRPAQVIISE